MSSQQIASIAFLCHPYHRGGVTSWMIDAAKECVLRKMNTFFITVKPTKEFISGKNRPSMFSLLETIKQLHLITPEAGLTFEFGTLNYRALIYASAILKSVPAGVPIIVSDDHSIWKGASYLAKRNPIIGVLHSDEATYFDLAKQYSSLFSEFVTVSKRIASKCKHFPELKSINFYVIPCGIVLPKFQPEDLSSNFLSLIWIGRIEENQKRVSDLPKIATSLKNHGVEFQLSIIGHGPHSNYLEEQIKANDLTDCVKLYGWQNAKEINEKLNQSDFLLMTSNYEGMSIAVMEALASGCGIISSRVSGVEDLESDPHAKKYLWLYPVGEIETAVDCILKAKEIPKTQRQNAARKSAEQNFSISTCMDQYLTIAEIGSSISQEEQIQISNKLSTTIKAKILSRLRYCKLKMIPRLNKKKSSKNYSYLDYNICIK